jgi:hypothetical protein
MTDEVVTIAVPHPFFSLHEIVDYDMLTITVVCITPVYFSVDGMDLTLNFFLFGNAETKERMLFCFCVYDRLLTFPLVSPIWHRRVSLFTVSPTGCGRPWRTWHHGNGHAPLDRACIAGLDVSQNTARCDEVVAIDVSDTAMACASMPFRTYSETGVARQIYNGTSFDLIYHIHVMCRVFIGLLALGRYGCGRSITNWHRSRG